MVCLCCRTELLTSLVWLLCLCLVSPNMVKTVKARPVENITAHDVKLSVVDMVEKIHNKVAAVSSAGLRAVLRSKSHPFSFYL